MGSKVRVIFWFLGIVGVVVLLSFISSYLWGTGTEKTVQTEPVRVEANMTLAEVATVNNLTSESMDKLFNVKQPEDWQKKIADLGLSREEARDKIIEANAFAAEEASKDWRKIAAKFVLWATMLVIAFNLLRKGKISPTIKKYLFVTAVLLFGVFLGSEPNTMSTPKDIISSLAIKGVFFPPRLIAFLVFLLTVFLANKFICAWGCQFGTLQDLIFRINRNDKDTSGVFKQYKVPFVISNSVRVLFFVIFVALAFGWAIDLIEYINPFKIFNPASMTLAGIIFTLLMLIASLFIYRPWCHFFCPFGLAAWLVEKISWNKIKVDYNSCIACEKCATACPSTVMEAILKQDRTIPDCFSCGTCMNTCPTGSIEFSTGKRAIPPAGKYKRKKDENQ